MFWFTKPSSSYPPAGAKGVCLKAIGLLSICNFQTIYQTCRLPGERQNARERQKRTEKQREGKTHRIEMAQKMRFKWPQRLRVLGKREENSISEPMPWQEIDDQWTIEIRRAPLHKFLPNATIFEGSPTFVQQKTFTCPPPASLTQQSQRAFKLGMSGIRVVCKVS